MRRTPLGLKVVRVVLALFALWSVALMFFPEALGRPLLRLPLWAQFVVGTLVVAGVAWEVLARALPPGDP